MSDPVAGSSFSRWVEAAYCGALFLTSAGALVVEIVAGRMIAPYVGMSLYTWTAIIAVVLGGLSIGHWIGGHLAVPHTKACHRNIGLALLLSAAATGLSLFLIRLIGTSLTAGQIDPILSIVGLTVALFFLPSLLVGIVSPVITRLAVDARPDARGRVIGRMFAFGAAGSIGGTLLAGYLFISWIGTTGSIVSIAAVYGLLGLAFAAAAMRGPAGRGILGVVVVAAVAVFVAAGRSTGAFTSPCTQESDYYCIRVIDLTGRVGSKSALMVLDHLGHGINVRNAPTTLASPYLAFIDTVLTRRIGNPHALRAFFVGGGAYSLPRAWRARFPASRLIVAEIDPAVTRAAMRRMWVSPTDSSVILHKDARVALRQDVVDHALDVVVGDAFKDLSVPTHLVTREFAALVRRKLKPSGFYALNIADSARSPRFVLAVAKTLAREFPSVELWMNYEQLRGGGRITFVAVAGSAPTPGDGRLKVAGLGEQLWLRWPPADLARRLAAPRVALLTDNYSPVDRLLYRAVRGNPAAR